jgi:acrylyl-CoA reductase (NADPH)
MKHSSISLDLEINGGIIQPVIRERTIKSPEVGEVKVAVNYSSVNYRDYLAFLGNRGVVRRFPYTPGVDLVGRIIESCAVGYSEGAPVALFSLSEGECYPGGWSSICITKANRLILLEESWPLECVAAVGTAGLAAASAIDFVVRNYTKTSECRPHCAITGATGGVGAIACVLAAKAGFQVTAFVRDISKAPVSKLHDLGVASVIELTSLLAGTEMNLSKQEFDGAIDTLGGVVTSALAKKLKCGGAMGVCGLVTSQEFPGLNLLPFLLRGISIGGSGAEVLVGHRRERVLELVSSLYSFNKLPQLYSTVPFSQLPALLATGRGGSYFGRVVVSF